MGANVGANVGVTETIGIVVGDVLGREVGAQVGGKGVSRLVHCGCRIISPELMAQDHFSRIKSAQNLNWALLSHSRLDINWIIYW
jgi:hypothetical protein